MAFTGLTRTGIPSRPATRSGWRRFARNGSWPSAKPQPVISATRTSTGVPCEFPPQARSALRASPTPHTPHLSRAPVGGKINAARHTELSTAVEALGLERYARHIFLCADQTEPQCAPQEAGLESWEFLKQRLKELHLVGPQ